MMTVLAAHRLENNRQGRGRRGKGPPSADGVGGGGRSGG